MRHRALAHITLFLIFPALSATAQGPASAPPEPVRVSAEEAQKHLLERVQPVYPPLAKAARIQGVVRLELTIDESGAVKIKLLSGHPMLAPAAIAAVKQWKYTPFEKDGKPVAVKTEVDVSIPAHIDLEDQKLEDKFQNSYWPAERAGEEALKKGDWEGAKKKLLIARAAAEERGEVKWLELAGTIGELGRVELEQKNYADSERLYKESLALHEKHQKPDEAEVGGALEALANVYMAQGDAVKAEPLLLRSVEIYKKRMETVSLPEPKAAYGRHIAIGSFWLVAIGATSHRPEMAQAHCKDALEYGNQWLTGEQKDIITRGCAEVMSKPKQ